MRQKYCLGRASDDDLIQTLAKKYGNAENEEILRQMFTTIVKVSGELKDMGDIKLINSTLKELRYALKIFAPYRSTRKVVIFGSHKIGENTADYKMASEFAEKIAEKGFMTITGGGGGIMEAGNRGAGPGKSFAVNIKLPTEQLPNAYVRGEKLVTLKYFFTRKLIFLKESDATVLFPGGFGTHDEGFEVLTLLQTGKNNPRPLVFIDSIFGSYWNDWFRFIKKDMLHRKLIYKDDINLFMITKSVDEAVEYVLNFYKVYHNLRYVGNKTILRLNKELTSKQIQMLDRKYCDILASGTISSCKPTPEEIKSNDHLDKFRLSLMFNKHDYGRLMMMIHDINRL